MANAAVIRWLLRGLGDPAFVRFYSDLWPPRPGRGSRPDFARLEDTFFALPTDSEHPEAERREAWRLVRQEQPQPDSPVAFMGTLLRILDKLNEEDDRPVTARARFWASPWLFDGVTAPESSPAPLLLDVPGYKYHETHAHLRGSVPFDALWQGWMTSERHRAALRKETVQVGRWRRTWAELAETAARAREALIGAELPASDEEHLVRTVAGLLRLDCPFQRQALQAPALPGQVLAGNTLPPSGSTPASSVHAFPPPAPFQPDCATTCLNLAACAYLGVFVGLRRAMIHQRGQAGLAPFVENYDRFGRAQKVTAGKSRQTRLLVRRTCQRFAQEGAVALELRPTLETTPVALRSKLRDIILGYFDYVRINAALGGKVPPLALGLVPSLFKQELISNQKRPSWQHWRTQRQVWLRQLEALFAALREDAVLRRFVVGLDAAGKERGCPPHALAPAYKRIRQYNRLLGPASSRPGTGMPVTAWHSELSTQTAEVFYARLSTSHAPQHRLGITCHAGEDFVDPLTGLRHIWETLELLKLGPGDRVGHALAAALSPTRLEALLDRRSGAPSTPGGSVSRAEVDKLGPGRFRLHKPRAEHLLDLAFLARVAPRSRRGEVQALLAGALPGLAVTSEPARALRHPPLYLEAEPTLALPFARYEKLDMIPPEAREWILIDEEYFARFEDARCAVIQELIRRQVVIESCPSSNVAVANLDFPPLLELATTPGLRVVMATDDPGLFESFPQQELDYVRHSAQYRPDAQGIVGSSGDTNRDLESAVAMTGRVSFVWAERAGSR